VEGDRDDPNHFVAIVGDVQAIVGLVQGNIDP
jgi:hypothetical protein